MDFGGFGNRVTSDNLDISVTGIEHIYETIGDHQSFEDLVILSPNTEGITRARDFQTEFLRRGFYSVGFALVVKQRSPSTLIDHMDLLGSVNGKDVIIVDDVIDTGETINRVADLLKREGAKKIYVYATHGVF